MASAPISPMKILVYGINYAPELVGIGKYTQEMCEWLAARGHQVKVVTAYPYYPYWKIDPAYKTATYSREQINAVQVRRCPLFVPAKPTGRGRLIHNLSFATSSMPAVCAAALRFRPDILLSIAPTLFIAPAALTAAAISGARSWLHIQDFEIDTAFELGVLSGQTLQTLSERIERAVLKRFDRISTISSKMVARLTQKKVSQAPVIEFRNWVDTSVISPRDRLTPLRQELGISADSIVALYSGSMGLKQGLDTLVEAARLIEQQAPHITMVLCGNGAMRNQLIEKSTGLKNVRFLELQPAGRVSEMLSTADIHLLPQRAEVADLVLPSKLSAMLASGRPVIAMAEPETQLAFEVKDAGLIIPAGDPPRLVAALMKLAGDPSLRDTMGSAARSAAQSRWDKNSILRQLEEQLASVIAARSPNASGALQPDRPR